MAYPAGKFNYSINFGNKKRASFSEVSAADWTSDPIEYREGTDKNMTVSKMPGLSKYGNITLKWGLTDDKEFADWVTSVSQGQDPARQTVTIKLMDRENKASVAEWEIVNAWPCKYTAPDLKAESNEAAFESVELAHEGFKRTK